jgi:hypothetical protein
VHAAPHTTQSINKYFFLSTCISLYMYPDIVFLEIVTSVTVYFVLFFFSSILSSYLFVSSRSQPSLVPMRLLFVLLFVYFFNWFHNCHFTYFPFTVYVHVFPFASPFLPNSFLFTNVDSSARSAARRGGEIGVTRVMSVSVDCFCVERKTANTKIIIE